MNNLPPLTERIDKGAAGGHEFERLLNQQLILFANHEDFLYEPVGGAGGDDGLDGIARDGGVPGFDGPVGFQFKWLWDQIHKGSKKDQILDSLGRASAAFPFLRHFVLITPHDLTTSERGWLLAQSPRPDLTVHHWGQARVESLLRECAPKLFARYFPHEAASADIGGAGGPVVIGDGNAVATGGSTAVVIGGNVGRDAHIHLPPATPSANPAQQTLANYLSLTATRYGALPSFVPLADKGKDPRQDNRRPPRLANVFVALEVMGEVTAEQGRAGAKSAAKTKTAGEIQGIGSLQPGDIPESRRVPVVRELAAKRHLVILGEPGSGKSTLLRHLCWAIATRADAHLADWPADQRPKPVTRRMPNASSASGNASKTAGKRTSCPACAGS